MGYFTNSERILHGSLYCLTFVTSLVDAGSYVAMGHVFAANMTGNVVFLGFAFGGVPGLSTSRCGTALGFALLGGFRAGKLDSWLGKGRRNFWLAAALAIETCCSLPRRWSRGIFAFLEDSALCYGVSGPLLRRTCEHARIGRVLVFHRTGLACRQRLRAMSHRDLSKC